MKIVNLSVANKRNRFLDFEVDKLTNSIENKITKESFATQVLPVFKETLRDVTKKNGWLFNWNLELKTADRQVFKLATVENLNITQGLMSLTIKPGFVTMNLIENAPFNRGEHKLYEGVLGNLVAFACKTSFATNGAGFVSFYAKTKLIQHYVEVLGDIHEGGHLMVIYPEQSSKLVHQYFEKV